MWLSSGLIEYSIIYCLHMASASLDVGLGGTFDTDHTSHSQDSGLRDSRVI
jgi:hypothetical protein